MTRSITLIVSLALVAQAYAQDPPWGLPPKTNAHLVWDLNSSVAWPPKVNGNFRGTLKTAAGPLLGNLPLKTEGGAGLVQFKKSMGPATWTVKSAVPIQWPLKTGKPIGIANTKVLKTPVGELSAEVTAPLETAWPPKAVSTLTLKNRFCTSLKCTPFDGTVQSIKVGKKFGKLGCALETDAKFNKFATIDRTFGSPVGDICCTLRSNVNGPVKPVGAVSLKKSLGNGKICCNLKALSTGGLTCSFESSPEIMSKKFKTTTLAPEAKPWWKFGADLAGQSSDVISTPAAFLTGVFAIGGLTLAVFFFRRRAMTSTSAPLLEA